MSNLDRCKSNRHDRLFTIAYTITDKTLNDKAINLNKYYKK